MKRDIAIDYLRACVTVAVVAHHAALAYNTFSRYDAVRYMKSTHPIVDAVRFAPLDIFVGWNDLFFMALMFLISGLFVAPSIVRKGLGRFVSDRAKRLGIPFLFAAMVLGPIAYYPSWLLSNAAAQGDFLLPFFTVDEGSAGPAWFIWLLLVFSVVAAIVYKAAPQLMARFSWRPQSPWHLAGMVFLMSLAATIPPYILLSGEWFRLAGPLILPAWRWPLYLVWFAVGIALGSRDPQISLSRENLKPWPFWLFLGAIGYLVYATIDAGKSQAAVPTWTMTVFLSAAFSFCCTFTGLGAIGLARACFGTRWSIADNLSDNAYGVYIFHYGFVTWLQFGLLPFTMPASVKFLITFSTAMAGSWLLTALLRKTAAAKVL